MLAIVLKLKHQVLLSRVQKKLDFRSNPRRVIATFSTTQYIKLKTHENREIILGPKMLNCVLIHSP